MDRQACASPMVISAIGIAWSPRVDIIFLEIRPDVVLLVYNKSFMLCMITMCVIYVYPYL